MAESTPTTTQEQGSTLLNQTEPAPPEPAEEGEKPAELAKAPESYEDFKVPQGFEIDGDLKTEVTGLFKGMNLSQDQAQSLIDFYVKQTESAFQAPFDAYKSMTDGWRTEAMDHPDLKGKLGPGQAVNVAIGKLLSALPDQKLASDFRSLMDLTGAGNHPAFIRAVYHWAQKLSEGSHVTGNGPSALGQSPGGTTSRPSAAQAIFPGLPSANR